MKAFFIVNERSGKRREFDVAELIRASQAFESAIVSTSALAELDTLVERAEREQFDVVFAVGGDGTVHELSRRLIGRRPALGVLPIGSGNGFARHIGIPINPADALRSCGGGRIETIDTAVVNDLPFLGVMGVGLDALVADRFASSSVRGLETYVREGLRAFADFKPDDYVISANGETTTHRAVVVAVANSGQYGNNARIAPLASLRDGLLDIVIVHDTHLLEAALLVARLFRGTIHEAAGVSTMRAAEVTLQRSTPGPAHLDGEPVQLPHELRIRVVPRSLRLLVPADVDRF